MFKKYFSLILLFAVIAMFSCSQKGSEIKWVGCGITKKAFMAPLAEEYEKRFGNKIVIEGGGATRGIRDVSAGLADLGGTCRYKFEIPEEENAVLVPIAWDALVFIVNQQNPVTDISMEQAEKIFLGEITNWSEVGGNDSQIEVCVRKGKISGVGRMARQLVFRNEDLDFTSGAKTFPSSGPLEEEIENFPNTIGITGISSAKKRNVKVVLIDGNAPTKENIISGDYPFCRPLYLSYHKNYDEKLVHFIRFAWGAIGQEIISKAGTVNLKEGSRLVKVYVSEMEGLSALPPIR